MGFMIPTAEYFAAYHVETNCGVEIVPEDVCGKLDLDCTDEYACDAAEANAFAIGPHVEGSRMLGDIERKQGWYVRLSAPGYLDCTSWDGPYATAKEALDAVKELYECDDDGDSEG